MLNQSQIDQFHRNGYLLGGQMLSDGQVDALREEMDRVIHDQHNADVPQPVSLRNMGTPDAAVWQIVDIWAASPLFKELVQHTKIAEEVAQLANAKSLRLWHDQIQYKPAAVGGVNMWHQDAPLWPSVTPMTQVSAWVALDDVDPENGCMSMVPGSHLWGDNMAFLRTLPAFDAVPSEFDGHSITVNACPVKKGGVHYHHALTWHASPANISGRPRRAVALHYMTEEARFVATGKHLMNDHISVADGDFIKGDYFPVAWPVGAK